MKESNQKRAKVILKTYRKEINELDNEILKLIGKRFAVIRKVARIKEKTGLPSFLHDRVMVVIERAVKLGKKYKINEKFVYGMYSSMIMHACMLEDENMNKIKLKKK